MDGDIIQCWGTGGYFFFPYFSFFFVNFLFVVSSGGREGVSEKERK